MGKDDFRKIPNGTGGVEDRMACACGTHGVRSGKPDPERVCRCDVDQLRLKIFNIHPRVRARVSRWAQMRTLWSGTPNGLPT